MADYRKYDVNVTVLIHHKGGYCCAIRSIRSLESLTAWGILFTHSPSNMSLSSCLFFTLMKKHLRHVHIQCQNTTKKTMTCNFWYRVSTGLSSHVSILYIVRFYFNVVLWLFNWDYESVSPNRKLNQWNAIIHVFTKTPPTQGSQKVVRFMQNEPQFILYRAQRTNVNIVFFIPWHFSAHGPTDGDQGVFSFMHLLKFHQYRYLC